MKNFLLFQRVSLVVLLVSILFFSYTNELVPHNEGLGWDGETYFSIVKDFDKLILTYGIDRYHMTRFLPFAVLHYVLYLFGIDINVESAILAARVMNFMLMIILVFYFFKLSTLLKWNPKTELIAFSFVFFNILVLKMIGYYPLLCDPSALVLSYCAIYYYIKKNVYAEILIGLLAMVTWPILSVVIILLMFFPRNCIKDMDENPINIYASSVIRLFFMFFPLVVFFYFSIRTYYANPGISIDLLLYQFKGRPNIGITFVSVAIIPIFYFYATSIFKVNWISIFKSLSVKRNCAHILVSFIILVFLYWGLTKLGGDSPFSLSTQIGAFGLYPSSDILVFLETHFIYLGLFFLLIVLCWKDIVNIIRKDYGVGYYFVLMLSMIFLLDIETRKLIAFYPIMLIPLMSFLQKLNLKWSVVILISIFCLISSFFWYQINTPEIIDAFNQDYHTYYRYPAQRYYQFLGPWQCHEVYWITIYFELMLGLLIVTLYKKGLLTNKE